jgi:hypothetical protein
LYFKCHTILKHKKNHQKFLRIDLKGKTERAKLEGLDKKSSSVRQLIIRTSDQLQAGELSLIEVTPEQAEAAKARLDTHRKKRRERHNRSKLNPNSFTH